MDLSKNSKRKYTMNLSSLSSDKFIVYYINLFDKLVKKLLAFVPQYLDKLCENKLCESNSLIILLHNHDS